MNLKENMINIKNELSMNEFQNQVEDVLIRHKSILDIITKLEEYTARINRAVIKSATSCGCIKITAKKQNYNLDSLEEIKNNLESHVEGELCPGCKEILEEEIGAYLFYLAALCNTFDVDISDAILKEYNNIKTLGIFSLK
ncbi:hypothetical protein EDD65_109109 [Keratinibaculum paraultunense]|uniref:DUF1573 domain-containing protein n=1 Tax=Keratinibaculum paraultunense TaxID=1278232 RepID=A0A4R3KSF5_9FIRM|nr:DUF1573 domain-containing protein [Keratinibaculum paraultunense]QQY79443.1 DUF1573 domain-containing protein [Keratinibaculum paraultunense]TCS88064.1 hypothetical protein EDD65_109109 [Keratinibaculum paraultunense]